MDNYADYDGLGLAELVERGEVSAAELVEDAIEQIERVNPTLNAVVYKTYDRARRQAAEPEGLGKGPFRGVPFLVKDLHAEEVGHPSTCSNKLLLNWKAPKDAELVLRYREAGVVILGRTNTPEFGIYGVTEPDLRGPTRNPWDTNRTPGGSSGGSASAVASGCVPLAHGGDGGGSIRIPSSHCGLFGLKPTRARNPGGPYHGESWSGFVSEHVLTRSVRDSAAMLDCTHGSDLGAPYQVHPPARPYREEVGADPGKLRVAFTSQPLFGGTTHQDCKTAVEEAAKLAESLGHHVEEARPDLDYSSLLRAYLTVVTSNTSRAVEEVAERMGVRATSDGFEDATWLIKLIGDKFRASDLLRVQDQIHGASRQMASFFQDYDVLLTPTTALPAVEIGAFALKKSERIALEVLKRAPAKPLLMKALDEMAKGPITATPNTMLFNMTGQPAMSTPLYQSGAGLPIGTQWVGRFGDEATLLRLAAQLEAAQPWDERLRAQQRNKWS